jgi:hypothetical protein
MSRNHGPASAADSNTAYEVRVKGQLGPQWTARFEGMSITSEENGESVLTGPVADQAALHGLLKKVRDLGLPLLSVTRLEQDPSE